MFFKNLFSKSSKNNAKPTINAPIEKKQTSKEKITSNRIGDLGEYKINIQLDQLPPNYQYLSDITLANSKAASSYSQIDHIVLTPYAIFVIETKNYAGTIYGDRKRKTWNVNGKFQMMNPFNQNFGHIEAIKTLLNEYPNKYVSIVSFTKRSTFKVNPELRNIQSDDLILYDIELSEFILRKCNVLKLTYETPIYSQDQLTKIYEILNKNNITSKEIKEKHILLNNSKKSNTPICSICGKTVSEKVESFCLSNKKRFNGNVYCFEHQK